ncbi:AMP-binding protein [Actinokineospora iranica]|uniref:Fatty-acyl-CoA synthase n=1 Tax=Actinokineospora iranica TaxID=1271860 RepID=A0A1G6LF67_9PSEU|nr:AMP-binding protein [Actinokineospora iranica]SDC41871.1 fatty-acyl-CoA synthase [Actinokineospora iranica]
MRRLGIRGSAGKLGSGAAILRHTAAALLSTGLAGQSRPGHLRDMRRAVRHTGTSPATLLAVAAAHRPDALGLVDDRGTLTFGQLNDAAARLARGLLDRHGLRPGATIAVLCRNHRGFVLTSAAAGRVGADVVYLNTEFSGPQLARVWPRLGADLLVVDEEFLPLVPEGTPRVVAWQDTTAELTAESTVDPVVEWSTLDGLVAGHAPLSEVGRLRQGKVTILTSGTTGAPKGAPRTPSPLAVLGPAVTILRRTGLRSGDPVLIGPPLFHGFGLAAWALAVFLRSPVVLRRRFDPEVALADIERHGIAFVAAVPVMLQRILALPPAVREGYDHGCLRAVLSGGAALRPVLAERFMAEFGDVLYNGYGSSEIGIAAVATPADLRAAPGTVGRPTVGVPARVLGADRRPVPAGQPGTIFVGGPLVFEGYTGGGTKEMVDGLMNTGDVGRIDSEGRLHVDGRADDMIVSGGENVYPQEVEDVLSRHPAVADVAVIGVDDDEFGQRLVAYVVARDAPPDPADLALHVKENLARYKVPRAFVFLPELPRNPTGKLLRGGLPR